MNVRIWAEYCCSQLHLRSGSGGRGKLQLIASGSSERDSEASRSSQFHDSSRFHATTRRGQARNIPQSRSTGSDCGSPCCCCILAASHTNHRTRNEHRTRPRTATQYTLGPSDRGATTAADTRGRRCRTHLFMHPSCRPTLLSGVGRLRCRGERGSRLQCRQLRVCPSRGA